MTIQRYGAQLQAAYSELVEQLTQAEIEQLAQHEGSFGRKVVKGIKYWYFRRRVGDKYDERYLGPETPELLERIKTLKVKTGQAKEAAQARRGLIRQLRAGGYLTPDRRTGRVLEELARAGVFRLNGVLVGTHAFRCYPALLGVKLDMQLALTADVDIAQDASVSLAVTDTADPALGDALAAAEKFIEIPALNLKSPSSGWQTPDRQLRVDVLTPEVGKPKRRNVALPILGAYAKPLRFLDFLLAETVRTAVLSGSSVLVRVPTPERYALHKLIVAQRRDAGERDKMRKDLAQAEALLRVLLQDQPDEVQDAWTDLVARGKTWRQNALRSLKQLPDEMRRALRA
jgi:hypothetical protein